MGTHWYPFPRSRRSRALHSGRWRSWRCSVKQGGRRVTRRVAGRVSSLGGVRVCVCLVASLGCARTRTEQSRHMEPLIFAQHGPHNHGQTRIVARPRANSDMQTSSPYLESNELGPVLVHDLQLVVGLVQSGVRLAQIHNRQVEHRVQKVRGHHRDPERRPQTAQHESKHTAKHMRTGTWGWGLGCAQVCVRPPARN